MYCFFGSVRGRVLFRCARRWAISLAVGEPTEQIHALPPCPFKVGNKVKVDMEPDVLKGMQEGHGGWNPKMAEVCFMFLWMLFCAGLL